MGKYVYLKKCFENQKSLTVTLTSITTLLAVALFLFQSHIGHSADTERYYSWASDFPHALKTLGDSYSIGRILPSITIYSVLGLFSVPKNLHNVNTAFAAMNSVLLISVSLLWCWISDNLKLGNRGKIVGWVTLVVNCATLKWSPHQPLMNDMFVYALSLATLLTWLRKNTFALAILAIAGGFTWPGQIVFACILLAIPPNHSPSFLENTSRKEKRFLIVALTILGVAIAANGLRLYLNHYELTTYAPKPINLLFPITIIGLGVFVVLGVFPVVDDKRLLHIRCFMKELRWKRIAFAVTIFGITTISQQLLTTLPKPRVSTLDTPDTIIWSSVAFPGAFAIAWIGFFGPILILGLLSWKKVALTVRSFGPALMIVTAICVLLGLNGQSRMISNVYPLIAPFIVLTLAPDQWSWRDIIGFTIISLAFSKLILPPQFIYDAAYGEIKYGIAQGLITIAAGLLLTFRFRKIHFASSDEQNSPTQC